MAEGGLFLPSSSCPMTLAASAGACSLAAATASEGAKVARNLGVAKCRKANGNFRRADGRGRGWQSRGEAKEVEGASRVRSEKQRGPRCRRRASGDSSANHGRHHLWIPAVERCLSVCIMVVFHWNRLGCKSRGHDTKPGEDKRHRCTPIGS
ncbi:hypothetical protein IWX90DRAFT_36591 [Phyllosticta citrichinensis]|uniref:Uncharacterized protein n=1 Tax=Phyllosticta citrichinensis TaxID=1130410 RepID=A0ABR1Y834_9PEZI